MIRKMVICTLLFGIFLLISGCWLPPVANTGYPTWDRSAMKEAAEEYGMKTR